MTKHHNFTLKTKKGADDYASAAELNLHVSTGGITDGPMDNLTTWCLRPQADGDTVLVVVT